MKNKKKMCFGVIIGTRAYFNSELAKDVRKQLLETLTKEGYDYVILPEDATPTGSSSIETREDGLKCAKLFRENRDRIDGIIVSLPNFGFEIGIINAISVADLNVPVLVQACDDENDKVDLDSRRDAFCGKISVCNNLYQYGIPFTDTTLHTYSIYSDLLAADINKFAAICRGLLELQDTLEAQARELADKEEKFRFTPEQIKAYSTIGGAPHLDGSYTVFGEVTEGMEVVDNIEIAKTNRADRPIENIRILKASIQ